VVQATLDELGDIGALMLLDVIEHLTQPQQLLGALSAWSLKHGEPALVVSVPNVSHFDLGLRLLSGQWILTETGMLDSTHLRFFTEETLERMFRRCGWRVVARNDFTTIRTDQYDDNLNDGLPAEMVGALRTFSESYNPNTTVQQFVWALKPSPVKSPPETYLEAVGRTGDDGDAAAAARNEQAVHHYLKSVGLVASERSRRGSTHSGSLPPWKQRALAIAYRSPRSAAVFQRVYRRLR
jgi:hypothetical protein